MNERQFHRILSDISEGLAPKDSIHLWPAIQNRLTAHTPHEQEQAIHGKQYRKHAFSRRAAWAVLALLLIGGFFLITPIGRVLAQEILRFFTRTQNDTLPLQSWQLTPQQTVVPGSDPSSMLDANLSVEEVEQLSGFDVKEPTWLPDQLTLVGATFDPPHSVVRIFYRLVETNGLVLKAEFYRTSETCALCNEIGASAAVETVRIGDATGEFVPGVWNLTEAGPIWVNDPYLKTLRWLTDGIAYELLYMGPPDTLSRDDMLKIASSLQ